MHDGTRSSAGPALGHGAGLASLRGADSDAEGITGEESGNGLLLFVETEGRDGLGEILNSEQGAILEDDGDADGGEIGIQDIGAMACGVHPLGMKTGGGRAGSDIFCNDAEAGASAGGAVLKIGFTGKLVGQRSVADHEKAVSAGGQGQRMIPRECGQAVRGALLVDAVEKELFVRGGGVGWRSAGGGGGERRAAGGRLGLGCCAIEKGARKRNRARAQRERGRNGDEGSVGHKAKLGNKEASALG